MRSSLVLTADCLGFILHMFRDEIREEGLVGTLFYPHSPDPLPLIIVLSGFRGGVPETRGKEISAHGFAALCLAYFGASGLPQSLQEIPLEYFEKAFAWAQSHPKIDGSRIALWGVSRGGELALLLGSMFPKQIQAIAAVVPSSMVYGAILTDAPAWVYRGKSIYPKAPLPPLVFDPRFGKEIPLALTPFFLEGLKDQKGSLRSQIEVEKIECPLLLISAGDDQMWPSKLYAEQILKRLNKRTSPISFSHLHYPKGGHGISSSNQSSEVHPVTNIHFAFGGTESDNEMARVDCWNQTVVFFQSVLIS